MIGTVACLCACVSRSLHSIFVYSVFCISVLFVFLACLFGRVITTLQTLDLGDNRLGDAGAVALAEALHVRQPIQDEPSARDEWMERQTGVMSTLAFVFMMTLIIVLQSN